MIFKKNKPRCYLYLLLWSSLFAGCASSPVTVSHVGMGWSNNSVNAVIFRQQAVTSANGYQFTAYYDPTGRLVLAKRLLDTDDWEVHTTRYSGHVADAHNSISMAIDAEGYLHVSWDQHNMPLRYAKSTTPYGLELTDSGPMTGLQENQVTYPEFHHLPNGKVLFCYRSGTSGRGNMVLNSYDVATRSWQQLQDNLLDGEEQRSAYWQLAVADDGAIHISWIWRETWDVATNHDLCYAVSYDGGHSWQRSDGTAYTLPITQATAEVAWQVPQQSGLINQTSMTLDGDNQPYIATYWNTGGIPQYKMLYSQNGTWQLMETTFRKQPFELGGGGTRQIPLSRPELLVTDAYLYLLFRDKERNNALTLAYTQKNKQDWKFKDLLPDMGQWEPNYDRQLWKATGQLHIFAQKVYQLDGEGVADFPPEPVHIVSVKKLPQ